MSPLGIEILLHYHYATNDFRDGDCGAPAVRELLGQFTHTGMLYTKPHTDEGPRYGSTARGTAFVDALCAMPLPVAIWRVPTPDSNAVSYGTTRKY